MKATPSIDFQTVDPTRESLVRFVAMLQKVYRNLAQAVNNQILHFNGVPSGNPLGADLAVDDLTGNLYVWFGGAWVLISGGSGGSGGIGIPGIDGLDADEPMMIPGTVGPAGAAGSPGATGPIGPMGLGIDGLDGEDGIGIPGPAGTGTGGAWTLISSQILGSDTATVTFSSIPGTYNHLCIIWIGRLDTVATNDNLQIQLNTDTGTNYDFNQMYDQVSTLHGAANPGTTSMFVAVVAAASATANAIGSGQILFPSYAQTNWNKPVLAQWTEIPTPGSNANTFMGQAGGTWKSTSAISRIDLFPLTAARKIKANSAFYLYGIT